MKNRRSCKAQLRTLQLPFLHIMRCLDDKVTIRILIAISHHMYIGEFLLAFELIIFPIIISICLFLFFHKIMLPLFQCHTLLYSNNYILQHPNITIFYLSKKQAENPHLNIEYSWGMNAVNASDREIWSKN